MYSLKSFFLDSHLSHCLVEESFRTYCPTDIRLENLSTPADIYQSIAASFQARLNHLSTNVLFETYAKPERESDQLQKRMYAQEDLSRQKAFPAILSYNVPQK